MSVMMIVHELRLASGSNKKKDILKKHKDNAVWRQALIAMYDSSINYYVSAPKAFRFIEEEPDYTSMFDILERLSNREWTGNMARDVAVELSDDYGELPRLILGGSLRCGVSITTINSVYPNLIPTFEVMLAKKDIEVKGSALASIKYDGVRIVARVSNGNATIWTRQGKVLFVSSLYETLSQFPDGVYDGELVHGNGKQEGRTKITGGVNKCLKGNYTDIEDYTFCIFDVLMIEEWSTQTCERPYLTRIRGLGDMCRPHPLVMAVIQDRVLTQDHIDDRFHWALGHGYEGLIVRYPDDVYEWKRSEALIKYKATHTCVLRCVSVLEGKGKYEGMIGALHCEGMVGCDSVAVKVGTGLSDFDRDMGDDYYVGRYIEVQYNDIVLAEGADYHSLFLPVYKRIRGDMNV